MTPQRHLPYDSHRCAPHQPDTWCKKCLRWHDLPGQTWGPRTPVAIGRNDSADERCSFIPIEEHKP
jgi:hypothetical protein